MKLNSTPWWQSDEYPLAGANDGLNMDDPSLWGPEGPALVQLWADGRTSQGWGRDTFMEHYKNKSFNARKIIFGYLRDAWAFAWVMRSARLICIDIDGKNGGFDHVSELGFLPPTTAEISMSGNGYHLFYLVEDEWDPVEGYGRYRDAIGLVTGVDIRGTGCVYHKSTQRWNSRPPAQLPEHLSSQLLLRGVTRERQLVNIQKTLELDKEEIAMMHDQLLSELKKPIPAGKRNNTLFAIGCQMEAAEIPHWDDALCERALQVGLGQDEAEKIVTNVTNYRAK